MLVRRYDILQVVYLPFVSIAINHIGINMTVMFGIVKPSATKILIQYRIFRAALGRASQYRNLKRNPS